MPGDGTTAFLDNSSAGSATINIYGDNRVNGFGGTTIFADSSTAANATINVYGSSAAGAEKSYLFFEGPSSAGNATLIAYGSSGEGPPGVIRFGGGSSGGTARIELLGNSVLFVDGQITIGSLEGTGVVDVSNFVVVLRPEVRGEPGHAHVLRFLDPIVVALVRFGNFQF